MTTVNLDKTNRFSLLVTDGISRIVDELNVLLKYGYQNERK